MPTFRLDLPTRPSEAEIAALQAELEPYGEVVEPPPVSYGLGEGLLILSFAADMVQGIDILIPWLKAWLARTPRAHEAMIRLSDGRTFEVKTTNERALRQALKAALKEL